MNSIYVHLTGKTRKDREKETPVDYWCFTDPDVPNTEVWADPHMFSCPICKHVAVDTGPWLHFMCVNCGLNFSIDFAQEAYGRNVMLLRSQEK